MGNQSVRLMPRLDVADGPLGNADATFSQRPVDLAISRTSNATSAKS